MSFNYLPNTNFATTAQKKSAIFTYAQSYYGTIIEIQGRLSGSPEVYNRSGSVTTVSPTSDDLPAKRFTPLAAVSFCDWETESDLRYVFYLDDNNRLCDAYFDTQWRKGYLVEQNWVAAPYSRLAAMKLTNNSGIDFICLYYQDLADSGDIKQVSYGPSGWSTGPPPINDPPLLGTSLSVVSPEAGIKSSVSTNGVAPVVFFQYNRLAIGSSQDQGDSDFVTYTVEDYERAISAHASIATVDDGSNCFVFYTSDDNNVQRMRIDGKGVIQQPTTVPMETQPIPASPLSAVMFKDAPETIVLFYLLRWATDTKSTDITNIYASTLIKRSTADADADDWVVSSQVRLIR